MEIFLQQDKMVFLWLSYKNEQKSSNYAERRDKQIFLKDEPDKTALYSGQLEAELEKMWNFNV